MEPTLQLDKMTTLEKIRAMEEIWSDLSKKPADVPVPGWHTEILSAREQQVQQKQATFTDWKEVRQLVRDKTR